MRSLIIVLTLTLLLSSIARSVIITSASGTWPTDWPEALEPLRDSARTIEVGTGIQQNIYEISFKDRESFEQVWPLLLRMKTPGAPLTLYRVNSEPPSDWGSLLSNAAPIVRIYGPSEGLVGDLREAEENGRLDAEALNKLIAEGSVLKAGPPWPEKIVSPTGGLPEFVAVSTVEGTVQWTDATQVPEGEIGFRHRARMDIELVVDGQVIDLNRIALPADTAIIDRRFAPPEGQ